MLSFFRMSKLERLNARVARLLTVAVHEVLDVVKETVSEYQEKTARTLRENDSLKRKVQELQEQLKSESAGGCVSDYFSVLMSNFLSFKPNGSL